MDENIRKTYEILKAWKGEDYSFGNGATGTIADLTRGLGKKALIVANDAYRKTIAEEIAVDLEKEGIECAFASGARPNAPREDVYRIEGEILRVEPDFIVAIGGGSTLDAAKAANVLATYGNIGTREIDGWFGTGTVSAAFQKHGIRPRPLVAVATSASSGSHLTKYSNVTDIKRGQKKLIVDDMIVPSKALFDYSVTCTMPLSVTIDGALDAISHVFEVYCGAKGEKLEKAEEIASVAISLVLQHTGRLLENPGDGEAREALGLATDLGGYAIMVGGTSGGHLTSFSLVDVAAHGTACGIMNPYYAVYYSSAIQRQLKKVGEIYSRYGFISGCLDGLEGRELALKVAEGMLSFNSSIGAPVSLSGLKGFSSSYVEKALEAAKDPQLEMKLRNMPVPMSSSEVEEFMRPVLEAAADGRLDIVKTR